jgi:hypothetical protein
MKIINCTDFLIFIIVGAAERNIHSLLVLEQEKNLLNTSMNQGNIAPSKGIPPLSRVKYSKTLFWHLAAVQDKCRIGKRVGRHISNG